MIPPEIEKRAKQLVAEAAKHGGFWDDIFPDTLEIIVRAVALDMQRKAEIAAERRQFRARLGIEESSGDSPG